MKIDSPTSTRSYKIGALLGLASDAMAFCKATGRAQQSIFEIQRTWSGKDKRALFQFCRDQNLIRPGLVVDENYYFQIRVALFGDPIYEYRATLLLTDSHGKSQISGEYPMTHTFKITINETPLICSGDLIPAQDGGMGDPSWKDQFDPAAIEVRAGDVEISSILSGELLSLVAEEMIKCYKEGRNEF